MTNETPDDEFQYGDFDSTPWYKEGFQPEGSIPQEVQGIVDWLETMEVLGIPTVDTETDLPEPDPEAETRTGSRRKRIVLEYPAVFVDTGTEWVEPRVEYGDLEGVPEEFTPEEHGNESHEDPFILLSEKGDVDGVAELDGDGRVREGQIPALAITETSVVDSESELTTLEAQEGDVGVVRDDDENGVTYILTTSDPSDLDNWQRLKAPQPPVADVFGRTGSIGPESGDYSFDQISNRVHNNSLHESDYYSEGDDAQFNEVVLDRLEALENGYIELASSIGSDSEPVPDTSHFESVSTAEAVIGGVASDINWERLETFGESDFTDEGDFAVLEIDVTDYDFDSWRIGGRVRVGGGTESDVWTTINGEWSESVGDYGWSDDDGTIHDAEDYARLYAVSDAGTQRCYIKMDLFDDTDWPSCLFDFSAANTAGGVGRVESVSSWVGVNVSPIESIDIGVPGGNITSIDLALLGGDGIL